MYDVDKTSDVTSALNLRLGIRILNSLTFGIMYDNRYIHTCMEAALVEDFISKFFNHGLKVFEKRSENFLQFC